jgi:hypothetical protein
MKHYINKCSLLVIAVILLGVTLWSCSRSEFLLTKTLPAEKSVSASTKNNVVVYGASGSNSLATLNELMPDPLAAIRFPSFTSNALGTRGTVAELRRLALMGSLLEAKIAAAQSDDPVLWINSLYMGIECMMPHFNRRHTAAKTSDDDPIKARIDKVAENWTAYRSYTSAAVEQKITQRVSQSLDQLNDSSRAKKYTEEDYTLFLQTLATVSSQDRAAFEEIQARMYRACEKGTTEVFGLLFRENRQRWVERGALGALIFDEGSGWTSARSLGELSERDYELVARAIAERSPDGLARLYLSSSAPLGDSRPEDAPQDWYMGGFVMPEMTRKLVLCELGLSDCSGGSSFHADACGMHGGCHQSDLASLIRYVLARDGLPPDLIDRNVARVLDAIRRGDLNALGIRKKPKP